MRTGPPAARVADQLPVIVSSEIQPSAKWPVRTIELLGRARTGEDDAFTELYRRYAPRVRGLVALRMGQSLMDLVDCDDIVQESLMAAFRKLDGFTPRSESSFICWLSRFVDGEVGNARRRARAQKRGGGEVRRRADLGVTTLAVHSPIDGRGTPSQELMRGEFDDELERALLSLGKTLREVVYCRLVLDMEFVEVATELELKSGDSARALYHKAIAQLRERMQSH